MAPFSWIRRGGLGVVLVLAACSGGGKEPVSGIPDGAAEVSDVAQQGDLSGLDVKDTGGTEGTGEQVCVPDCAGKQCGDDGCGGECGTCPEATPLCDAQNQCVEECKADCEGKECGDDGCGGSCGQCPGAAPYCVKNLCVVDCSPSCEGKECGDDGCGTSCGDCDAGFLCKGGECVSKDCKPDCTGKVCGSDGCGGNCGSCEGSQVACESGSCVCKPSCPPGSCGEDGCGGECPDCGCGGLCVDGLCVDQGCGDLECGENPCGKVCGTCPLGATCTDGKCFDSCEKVCVGKACGSDGCGGWCGKCPAGQLCTDIGQCVTECVPNCEGNVCGADGCGGTCGACKPGTEFCVDGKCSIECIPQCDGKACGSDGCGGACAKDCSAPYACTVSGTCGSTCAQCANLPGCYDLDFSDGTVGGWGIKAASLVSSLGKTEAPTGGYMLKLTTGEGITELDSSAAFQNCLPQGDYMVAMAWKFYSEEFEEWCGSTFQDSFTLTYEDAAGVTELELLTIDSLCSPKACATCGADYDGLTKSDIVLDQGDVWETDWQETWYPITLPSADTVFTLRLVLADAGDGIYDSAMLIDRIRLIPCLHACDYIECGSNPCGGKCGECPEGGVCQGGSCCYPQCQGKVCGDDGCGGECGSCAEGAACTPEGKCE